MSNTTTSAANGGFVPFLFSAVTPITVLWVVLVALIFALVRMAMFIFLADWNKTTCRAANLSTTLNGYRGPPYRFRRPAVPPPSRRVKSPMTNPGNVTWPSPGSLDSSAMLSSSLESPRSRYAGKPPKVPRLLRLPLLSPKSPDTDAINMNDTPNESVVVNMEEEGTPTRKSLRERGDALLMMGGYAYGSGTPSRRFLETVIEDREIEFCG
uniref:Uncharacterized protein n=1 Tax=Steinernema glaseri TaxID=37863 RepID=A0A1I7Z1F7_9BILA